MRRLPPVYSPLSLDAVLAAAIRGPTDPVDRFNRRLARRLALGKDQVVLTGSGTDALRSGLETVFRAVGRGPVAMPAYTCWDVGTAVQGAGGEGRLYDVDPRDLTPDLDSLERALTGGVVALIVSPLFGYPVDWHRLKELAVRHGSVLVEDSAQAHGSAWSEGAPGTVGDLSILSFGRGKGWTGSGGGALAVASRALASPLEHRLRPAGRASGPGRLVRAAAQAILARPSLYALPSSLPGLRLGESVYHPPEPPRGISGLEAALALSAEAAAEEEARHRRRSGPLLLERIPVTADVQPVRPAPGGQPGFLRLPVLVRDPSTEWERKARRVGVVRGYPRTLAEVPPLKELWRSRPPPLPGARELAERLFTVPTHSQVAPRDVERIVALLSRA